MINKSCNHTGWEYFNIYLGKQDFPIYIVFAKCYSTVSFDLHQLLPNPMMKFHKKVRKLHFVSFLTFVGHFYLEKVFHKKICLWNTLNTEHLMLSWCLWVPNNLWWVCEKAKGPILRKRLEKQDRQKDGCRDG